MAWWLWPIIAAGGAFVLSLLVQLVVFGLAFRGVKKTIDRL